jgi:hypothetical protein
MKSFCFLSCLVIGSGLVATKALADEMDVPGPAGMDEFDPAAIHSSRLVIELHSPDNRPCAFFRLVGVSQADPVTPNNPWFSVPTNHLGYDVIIDSLRAAILHDKRVTVYTTGGVKCGHASVLRLRLYR